MEQAKKVLAFVKTHPYLCAAAAGAAFLAWKAYKAKASSADDSWILPYPGSRPPPPVSVTIGTPVVTGRVA